MKYLLSVVLLVVCGENSYAKLDWWYCCKKVQSYFDGTSSCTDENSLINGEQEPVMLTKEEKIIRQAKTDKRLIKGKI